MTQSRWWIVGLAALVVSAGVRADGPRPSCCCEGKSAASPCCLEDYSWQGLDLPACYVSDLACDYLAYCHELCKQGKYQEAHKMAEMACLLEPGDQAAQKALILTAFLAALDLNPACLDDTSTAPRSGTSQTKATCPVACTERRTCTGNTAACDTAACTKSTPVCDAACELVDKCRSTVRGQNGGCSRTCVIFCTSTCAEDGKGKAKAGCGCAQKCGCCAACCAEKKATCACGEKCKCKGESKTVACPFASMPCVQMPIHHPPLPWMMPPHFMMGPTPGCCPVMIGFGPGAMCPAMPMCPDCPEVCMPPMPMFMPRPGIGFGEAVPYPRMAVGQPAPCVEPTSCNVPPAATYASPANHATLLVTASGNHVHVVVNGLDAQCDKLTRLDSGDIVILEGNVRIKGKGVAIQAQRVEINLGDGSCVVQGLTQETISTEDVSPVGCHRSERPNDLVQPVSFFYVAPEEPYYLKVTQGACERTSARAVQGRE